MGKVLEQKIVKTVIDGITVEAHGSRVRDDTNMESWYFENITLSGGKIISDRKQISSLPLLGMMHFQKNIGQFHTYVCWKSHIHEGENGHFAIFSSLHNLEIVRRAIEMCIDKSFHQQHREKGEVEIALNTEWMDS